MTPPIRPGPAVAATPEISGQSVPALSRASAATASMVSTWARAAISGTTPPKGACRSVCNPTTEDSTVASPDADRRTTAAAVSSQLVSTPRTVRSLMRAGVRVAAPARLL